MCFERHKLLVQEELVEKTALSSVVSTGSR